MIRGPWMVMALVWVLAGAEGFAAPDAEGQYADADAWLRAADAARDVGDDATALQHYKTALTRYAALAGHPGAADMSMTMFRMAYCDNQIAALLKGMTQEDPPEPDSPVNPVRPPSQPMIPLAGAEVSYDTEMTNGVDVATVPVRAWALLLDGDGEAARQLLMAGFREDPDHRDLRLLAGLAQCQAHRFDDALFLLRELAKDYPNDAAVHLALAAALFGSGDMVGARRELETVLTQNPRHQQAHYNLAQVLIRLPQPEPTEAGRHYQAALELGAPPDERLARRLFATSQPPSETPQAQTQE